MSFFYVFWPFRIWSGKPFLVTLAMQVYTASRFPKSGSSSRAQQRPVPPPFCDRQSSANAKGIWTPQIVADPTPF